MVFGAYATQMLGDQGAEVIKLEDPGSAVATAATSCAGRATAEGLALRLGPIFLTINRNKRSVLIDLKGPEVAQGFGERPDRQLRRLRHLGPL